MPFEKSRFSQLASNLLAVTVGSKGRNVSCFSLCLIYFHFLPMCRSPYLVVFFYNIYVYLGVVRSLHSHRPQRCSIGHTYSKSVDQPGQVANPARGQLNNRKMNISLSPFAPENLVSRDGFGRVPSRVSLLIFILRLAVLTYGILPRVPRRRPFVHLKPPYAIGSVPTFVRSRSCAPMAFTAESPPAQGQ